MQLVCKVEEKEAYVSKAVEKTVILNVCYALQHV